MLRILAPTPGPTQLPIISSSVETPQAKQPRGWSTVPLIKRYLPKLPDPQPPETRPVAQPGPPEGQQPLCPPLGRHRFLPQEACTSLQTGLTSQGGYQKQEKHNPTASGTNCKHRSESTLRPAGPWPLGNKIGGRVLLGHTRHPPQRATSPRSRNVTYLLHTLKKTKQNR